MSADLSDVERFHDQVIDARPVVHDPKVGFRGMAVGGAANSSFNSLLKSQIFRTSYINILLHEQNQNTVRSL